MQRLHHKSMTIAIYSILCQTYHTMSAEFLFMLITPLLLLLLFSLIQRWKKITRKETKKLPPGPWKLPLIGNLHQLIGNVPHRSLQLLSHIYGPLMFLQLGSIPTIVISSSDIAREIFKTHDVLFSSRPIMYASKKISYGCSDIAFAPYGEYWREVRKITILELLSAKRIQSFRAAREEEVDVMISHITHSSSSPINVSNMMVLLVNNVICRVVFGNKCKEEGDIVKSRFHVILQETQDLLGGFTIADFFPSLGWINKLNGLEARLERNFRELDSYYDEVIEEHLDPKWPVSHQEYLVDVLLRVQKDPNQAITLTRDQIKGVLTDMFIAGTDTSSAVLVWAMAELVKNPIIMKRAQDEIRRVIGKKAKVEESDLPGLSYLKLVVQEALRLHPPAPIPAPRETTEDCTVRGYEIPAKTRVFVNVRSIATDVKIWENPEDFLPERFLNNSIDVKGHSFEMLPFGVGRRGCPGSNFAIVLMELVLANLLHCFDWKLPHGLKIEDMDMKEAFGLTMHKKSPLCLVATPANVCKSA